MSGASPVSTGPTEPTEAWQRQARPDPAGDAFAARNWRTPIGMTTEDDPDASS